MSPDSPGQPAQLLLDIVSFLTRLEVPYAVIGAFAVSYYGIPRSTLDVDAILWLAKPKPTVSDLQDLFADNGYSVNLRRGDPDDPVLGMLSVEDIHRNHADLILGLRGMTPDASNRRIAASLLGSPIFIIGMEDLTAMKLSAGGPRDLDDVRGILEVSRELLNVPLLRTLTASYGSEATQILEKLLPR